MTAPLPARPVHAPPPSPANRVRFWWGALWSLVFTATLSPGVVLHSTLAPTARTLRAWMRPWARSIYGMAGLRVRAEHRAPLPDGPVVFVANHVNALDIPTSMLAIPRPFLYVARHELKEWPFVGWVLDKSACLFIQRDNPRQALLDLRRAAERIRGGDSVLLFPEGGRSYGHALRPFMRGAFLMAVEAGVPVVPMTVVGHAGLFSAENRAIRRGEALVVFGEAIPTAGLERGDAQALCDRVRGVMEAELSAFGEVRRVETSD